MAGGAYAYQNGGWDSVLDGALSGAHIGGMVGGIAAPFFVACFAAGEHIWTEHGSEPIETLKVGDVVLSRDEFNVDGPLVAKRIEETFERTGELFLLTVNGTQFKTTAEHPFYSKEHGWVPASELEVDEEIFNEDMGLMQITVLKRKFLKRELGHLRELTTVHIHGMLVPNDDLTKNIWTALRQQMSVIVTRSTLSRPCKNGSGNNSGISSVTVTCLLISDSDIRGN